eukprot:CAMPEP_0118725838 /NCGR_PEP_ID=MMETSP0800-20121206/33365_1 /TAXON_ID=210618 ORGANISM="Striatella unipunctata, Strain CCMP2910" /NCGR_SAMPLE_ID=MMETSP0800 /ASSEMBLY_ACC=CAM_ASM_000638 /LENGTH=62 /DNA_ID=CAMNT_0006634587 /DNA_START=94 /DNA_END=282 /DNA_ORIENTATION=-
MPHQAGDIQIAIPRPSVKLLDESSNPVATSIPLIIRTPTATTKRNDGCATLITRTLRCLYVQ